MNRRELELVFVIVVENEAVLLDEADHRGLPAGTLDEGDQRVENPVLCRSVA